MDLPTSETTMKLGELIDELDGMGFYDDEIVIEINGVQHPIQEVQDSISGVTIIVDTDQEDREMR